MPGTSLDSANNDIYLAICIPCSASGTAFPTIRSSIFSFSKPFTDKTRFFITSAARSSGLVNLKPPFFAFPTADLFPATIYAFININF